MRLEAKSDLTTRASQNGGTTAICAALRGGYMSYMGFCRENVGFGGICGVWGYYPNDGESMAKKMDNEAENRIS